MRAWACGERSSRPYSIRGRKMSSAYFARPVRWSQVLTLGRRWPMTEKSLTVARSRVFRLHHARRLLDGLVDGGVSGATAEIAADGMGNLVATRRRISLEQCLGAEHH